MGAGTDTSAHNLSGEVDKPGEATSSQVLQSFCDQALSDGFWLHKHSRQLGLRSLLPCHEQEQLYRDSSKQFTFKAQRKLLSFSSLL